MTDTLSYIYTYSILIQRKANTNPSDISSNDISYRDNNAFLTPNIGDQITPWINILPMYTYLQPVLSAVHG
ncbi:hypothetical protein FKM82_025619 [Ascaphus truei]